MQNTTNVRKTEDSRPPLAKRPSSQMSAESPDNSKRFSSSPSNSSSYSSSSSTSLSGGSLSNAFSVPASGTPYTSPSKSHLGSPASTVAPSSVAYQTRKDVGQVAVTFNESLPDRGKFNRSTSGPLGFRCRISTNNDEFENISEKYRFMFTPLWERARALDRHLHRIQKDICEKLRLPESSLVPVGQPSPETVWVVGRVVCESSTVSSFIACKCFVLSFDYFDLLIILFLTFYIISHRAKSTPLRFYLRGLQN
jgi:hypothetical protein